MHDERAQRIAVRGDEYIEPGHQLRHDHVVPVRQCSHDHVVEALGGRQDIRRESTVSRVVDRVFRTRDVDGRRRNVVTTPPHLHLFGAEALGRLLLVETLQRSVVALVESPVPLHRQPHHVHRLEREMAGQYRACLHRRVGDIEPEAFVHHRQPGRRRFTTTLVGQVDVVPTGEQIESIPFALAVAKQHQCTSHGRIVGRTTHRHERTPTLWSGACQCPLIASCATTSWLSFCTNSPPSTRRS